MTAAELRELLAKATPGPWEWSENGNILGHMPNGYDETREVAAVYSERDDDLAPINAQLILAMHEALPALLAAAEERDALRARLDAAPVADVCFCLDYAASLDGENVSDDNAIRALIGGPQVRIVIATAPPVAGGGE